MKGQGAALSSGPSKAGSGYPVMDRSKVSQLRLSESLMLISPGTLVVHPILQPSTAYWMLRPFFKPTRKGSLDGWKFSLDDEQGNVYLHGANPGTAQEHTPDHHPHLMLEDTMIPYPTVEPGDTGKASAYFGLNNANFEIVFWSADTIHGTESDNTGDKDACVFYIPSVPLTPSNAVR